MQREVDLLKRTYASFNARDIDAVLATMHPDVAWPNGMEGGYLRGRDAVRDYWTRQWRVIDPHVEPKRFEMDEAGRIVLDVQQHIRDLAGNVLGDRVVQHVYSFADGLITHMEIVPVFGDRPRSDEAAIRPSAYGLISNGDGRLAIVRAPSGVLLPGGGIDAGETAEQAVARETLEECGLVIELGSWRGRAVQFVHAKAEGLVEKRSTFIEGRVVADRGPAGAEPDHELMWIAAESTSGALSVESHAWAVDEWRRSAGAVG